MPFPNSRVIPDGWAAHHRPTAQGAMTATVALRLPGTTNEWDPELQQTVPTPHPPYATDQPARIQAVTSQATAEDAAGETVYVRGYLVGLPIVVTPTPGDVVTVTVCDDATLIGRDLAIVDVLRGSLLFERDIFCTLND